MSRAYPATLEATVPADSPQPIIGNRRSHDRESNSRVSSIDALRAGAMLLVVVAHAALAYIAVRIPGLLWALRDPSRSRALDALFWGSVGIAMPIFFMLSGLCTVQIEEQKGWEGFVRDRTRRILIPFLAGLVVLLPVTLVVWGLGWLTMGWCTFRQLIQMRFLNEFLKYQWFGPAHLWFLEYLLLMLAAYGLARAWRGRAVNAAAEPRPTLWHPWLFGAWGPCLFAIPTALILGLGHRWQGFDAMANLRNSFVPDPFRWLHHAWFFVAGTLLAKNRDEWREVGRSWRWHLPLAGIALVIRLSLLQEDLVRPVAGIREVALATSGALFGWLALFGVWGFTQNYLRMTGPLVRYLAESSYWVYLVHFPILGLIQVALYSAPWNCAIKFAVVVGLTLTLSLASYETLVRRTWVGNCLSGRRDGNCRVKVPRDSDGSSTCPSGHAALR